MVQIENGWIAFTPISEWSRLLTAYADEWRVSYLNKDYKICNSYPSTVIVPCHIEDKIIISSANFRDGGRFPILCYRHEGGVCSIILYKTNKIIDIIRYIYIIRLTNLNI